MAFYSKSDSDMRPQAKTFLGHFNPPCDVCLHSFTFCHLLKHSLQTESLAITACFQITVLICVIDTDVQYLHTHPLFSLSPHLGCFRSHLSVTCRLYFLHLSFSLSGLTDVAVCLFSCLRWPLMPQGPAVADDGMNAASAAPRKGS